MAANLNPLCRCKIQRDVYKAPEQHELRCPERTRSVFADPAPAPEAEEWHPSFPIDSYRVEVGHGDPHPVSRCPEDCPHRATPPEADAEKALRDLPIPNTPETRAAYAAGRRSRDGEVDRRVAEALERAANYAERYDPPGWLIDRKIARAYAEMIRALKPAERENEEE